ncbi:ABC transporter permease [Natronoarchaeum sp. GCM10025703]|uniref:ABC transporter permease n=1 Tax=unclassified Natronoarchaeum TaxID=2620183 RepID=UPI00360C2D2D
MSGRRAARVIFGRELASVARSRSYLLLFVGVAAVIVGIATVGGGTEAGYVPTAVDLLLPLELLVPVVAFGIGYRSIADDVQREELEVLNTYPVPDWAYVGGVYAGRAVAVVTTLAVPLIVVGVLIWLSAGPGTTIVATHRGIDSPVLFGRFISLTLGYALMVLSVVLALSALASSRKVALTLAVVGVGGIVVGLDLLVLRGVGADWIASDTLVTALAASPASAFRGLVFETVLYVAFDAETGYASPVASAFSLVSWTLIGLSAAAVGVSRR